MSPSPSPQSTPRLRGVPGLLALTGAILSLSGCGGVSRPTCQPVSGVVLIQGKPAEGVCVSFHPLAADSGNTIPATGKTGKDGKFELSSFLPGDGAPPGEYSVTIIWPLRFERIGEQEFPVGDRLGGAYAQQAKTPLKATVREGVNEVPPFELASKTSK